jgi:hypothetical protein
MPVGPNRRAVIAALSGAAVWPLVARAQQPDRVRRIGVLLGATEAQDPESQSRVKALREGLEALGWSEGRISGSIIVLPVAMLSTLRPTRQSL